MKLLNIYLFLLLLTNPLVSQDFDLPVSELSFSNNSKEFKRHFQREIIDSINLEFSSDETFQGWFWQNPLPQGNLLYSVEIIATGFGIAVGNFGTILKTIDGGLTWEIKSASITYNLIKVDVVNDNTIYAIGPSLIIKSTDGGENWFIINNPSNAQSDVYFLNEMNGYIVGDSGAIFETIDGGVTWINQISGTSNFLNCIYFLNENIGIIGGIPNTLLYTTDGGNAWSPLPSLPPNQDYMWDVYLINNKIFVLAGNPIYDRLFMSTDYGQSWISMMGISNHLFEISFADSINGLIAAYNHSNSNAAVFRTTNGGFNWQEISFYLGYQTPLLSVSFPDIYHAASVGYYGRMIFSSDTGSNWQQISSGPLTSFYDVSFFNESNGIAIGLLGVSVATSDGGENWIETQGGSGFRCTMPSENICFTAGGYNLAKSTDGGFTWVQHPISSEHYFMTISFCDTMNGVATAMQGPQGKVIRTFDGGETWSQIGSIQGHYIYDVCFINPLLIYACSGSSKVFKSTDGGYTWTQQNTGISGSILYAIDFVNPDIGFAAGQHGKIIKTTNGGTNWTLLNTSVNSQFEQIDFKDENNGLAACGRVLHTSDGGNSWSQSINSDNITSVSMTSEYVWYAVGQDGSILKTINGGTPVELISFTIFYEKNKIHLTWQTATETNNQGFSIERKFQTETWQTIAFVEGNGTTTEQHSYSFIDKDVKPGKYLYRLKQIDYDGSFEYSNVVEVEIGNPKEYSLFQNYPNPFNPTTRILYQVSSNSQVTLKVYDILGREISTLVNEEKPAGEYEVEFRSSIGSLQLASGIYYYQLRAGNFIETKKMLLIK